MKKTLEDIKKLEPIDQLEAFAELIKQVSEAMHSDAPQIKAEVVTTETHERRERPRNA